MGERERERRLETESCILQVLVIREMRRNQQKRQKERPIR